VRVRLAGAFLAVLAAVSTLGARASAFCRTTTCESCKQPEDGCVTQGTPLFWPRSCVSYSVQKDATRWADLAEATRVVDASFDAWTKVICPGTAGGPSLKLVNIGPVACRTAEYNDGVKSVGGNANVVVFYDDAWNSQDDQDGTLALTTVTYDWRNGEFIDADILVNGQNVLSTATPVPSNAYDMQSLLMHEVGHFIGLSHSRAACSVPRGCPTMHALYPKGDDSYRTLETDDVAGVCAAYPPGRQANAWCIPDYGFSTECGIDVTDDRTGCQAAGGRPRCSGALAVLLGAIGASWMLRKRLGGARCHNPA